MRFGYCFEFDWQWQVVVILDQFEWYHTMESKNCKGTVLRAIYLCKPTFAVPSVVV